MEISRPVATSDFSTRRELGSRMQGRTLGFGQAYRETSKDKKGEWLDGG